MSRPASRSAQLTDERRRIRDAAERLLTGVPHRSNGTLTISTLATDAALSRQRLYEHHPELVAELRPKPATPRRSRTPGPCNSNSLTHMIGYANSKTANANTSTRSRPSARSSPSSPTKPKPANWCCCRRGGCPRIEWAGLAGDLVQGVAQCPAGRVAESGADATGASQVAVAVVAGDDQRAEQPRVGS